MKKSSRSLSRSGGSIEKLVVDPGPDPLKQVGFAGSRKYALSSRKCAWKCLRFYQEFRMSTMMSTDFSKFVYCKMSYDIVAIQMFLPLFFYLLLLFMHDNVAMPVASNSPSASLRFYHMAP